MSELTKSISQVLKNIKNTFQGVDVDLFKFPEKDISCAISITEIKKAQRTGEGFQVEISLIVECRVSTAIENPEIISLEVAADILNQIHNQSFKCSAASNPKNEQALPYGYDDKFAAWVVTWDQEFWVEKLNYEL